VTATITDLERATAYFYRLCMEDSARKAPPACSDLNTVHTGDAVRADNAVFRNDPVDGFLADVVVDATSGPAGEEPAGRVDFDYTFPDERPDLGGPVTCLRVHGQRAAIGVADESGNDFVLFVAVTGTTATGQNKDMGLFPPPANPAQCPDPDALAPAPWTIAGGIPVIIDGP
jgi:hypothetical protein